MYYRSALLFLFVCASLASCRKTPVLRRTDITGQVTHYGKGYPETNVKVIATAYYKNHRVFSPPVTKIVGSGITDQNGNYSLQFSIDVDAVDSIRVSGQDVRIGTSARVEPGKINQHINLSVSTQLPVVFYDLHIINNDHPPLVLTFSPVDSIIVTAQTDNIKAYRANSSLLYSSYAPESRINASFNAYYNIGAVKKTQDIIAANLPYQDTILVADTINAATFR